MDSGKAHGKVVVSERGGKREGGGSTTPSPTVGVAGPAAQPGIGAAHAAQNRRAATLQSWSCWDLIGGARV